jgi:CheY-like chemotaxis protein
MMERQVGQMVRLIDDLLDLSRVSRGKLDLRPGPVELAAVIHQAVETCRPLAEGAGHDLAVDLPPRPVYLTADRIRLAQVFSNLLGNACKFTEPGGRIRLTARRRGGEVVVSVTDTGVGIPADQLDRIFEMFSQVDRTLERAQGGLGIGLTLVRRLVERPGGRGEARRDGPGRGSEFVVRLPAGAPDRPPPGPPAGGSGGRAAAARWRVLIADDNRDGAASLALLLTLTGNEAHTAHDGQEAVEKAAALRPDVILLDIGMPKLNGYDACRRIREQPWGRAVVLVAVTGWGQDEDKRRSREAGFDHHLVKPVDADALQELLAGLAAPA